tara:strand:+ start:23895 stop:25298 length:1404 start_codon:yes stop_codon:yes gene_type:complete
MARLKDAFNILRGKKPQTNKYAEAFFKLLGSGFTSYDSNAKTYLEDGYGINADVYSVIQQMATKTVSIPYYVKRIKDEQAKSQLTRLRQSTKHNYNPRQYIKSKVLETKAFEEKELPFPLDRPNPTQTWGDVFALYKTFMRTTGNFYLYMLSPEDGINKGVPMHCYVLPSHLMQIVLKKDVDLMGNESPISHYILTEGTSFVEFEAENVIHVKFANPFFDFEGSHLYGLSPLKAALKNIQSSNEALTNNIKTMQNGGAFGFLHSKGNAPLQPEQAKELKDRMMEMDASPERLSKIAGVSAEIGFTRIALNTDELKPFDYLKYDQKAICNVLGWSDKLLNNDEGAKYSNVNEFRKQVVTDNIIPDLNLLEEALEESFLPRFKGYENTVIDWDYSELPEMQDDMEKLSKICNDEVDRGIISRDEYRAAMRYPMLETPEMQVHTVSLGIQTLEDAILGVDMVGDLTIDEE